jgi:hypothetical protein
VFAFFGYGESFRDEAQLAHLADDFGAGSRACIRGRVVVFSAVPREAAKGRRCRIRRRSTRGSSA